MRYVTREHIGIDRAASAWLLRRFIDPAAEFVFRPGPPYNIGEDIPFDIPGVELSHHGGKCTFEILLVKHGLSDPALSEIAFIIHGADIPADADITLESPGFALLASGFQLTQTSDEAILARWFEILDALYAALCNRLGR
ncbi:MAG: chromate resistance protein ChrB domain-containing protein [Bacteroidota bacterium]